MERIKITLEEFERLIWFSDNFYDIEDFVNLTFEPYLKSALTELEELKKYCITYGEIGMIVRLAIKFADDVETMKSKVSNVVYLFKTDRYTKKQKEELFTILQNTAKMSLYKKIFSSVYEVSAIKIPLINLLLEYDRQERMTLLECATVANNIEEDFESIYSCIKHIDSLIEFTDEREE